MRSFYIEVDTNDGDYVGHIVTISKEDFERFKSLIENIKRFNPNEGSRHNFCVRDMFTPRYDKDPQELYNIDNDTVEDFIETFELYGSEYGFHTITKIQEVILGEEIL